jgi:integrase
LVPDRYSFHTAATEIRAAFGLEAAQDVLGHSSIVTTERYAKPVSELAVRVAAERG